jgi:arsenate reductase (thioredoxin)
MTAHWGVEDPAAANGDELTKEAAFAKAFYELRNRIAIFVDLPLESFSKPQLKEKLWEIGRVALANPGP